MQINRMEKQDFYDGRFGVSYHCLRPCCVYTTNISFYCVHIYGARNVFPGGKKKMYLKLASMCVYVCV